MKSWWGVAMTSINDILFSPLHCNLWMGQIAFPCGDFLGFFFWSFILLAGFPPIFSNRFFSPHCLFGYIDCFSVADPCGLLRAIAVSVWSPSPSYWQMRNSSGSCLTWRQSFPDLPLQLHAIKFLFHAAPPAGCGSPGPDGPS